ncbi:MAG: L,D-transpeptidase family protein, partial [Methylococcaceae bacterium]|nr:L,D-transpeptidase family protein [Methylococcaceae bacterium]
ALLAACSGQKTANHSAQSYTPSRTPRDPTMNLPIVPKEPGQWTVEDVLQDYGAYVERKLKPYFAKAKLAYPPREITLIALKTEKRLEVWARGDGEYRFIRDYDIQAASGVSGPKLNQGDRQVPEGIYRIVGLNPNSNYHLSMKLNYPNEFDRFHAEMEGRFDPGSDIFIHGKAVSIGCLAMGDEAIEELFVLAAQVGKENMKVVIAPHDPRRWPLEAGGDDLPEWTPELYAMISREIQRLSNPLSVSNSGSSFPSNPQNRRR